MGNTIGNEFVITKALRDEKINIQSMTFGGMPGKYSHQIILCKKGRFEQNIPQLLVPKVTPLAKYKESELGKANHLQFERDFTPDGRSFPLEYVGFPAGAFIIHYRCAGARFF